MTKREFATTYSQLRERFLRAAYKGDPHGQACLTMSLLDVPKEADRIWRKHRSYLKDATVEELVRRIEAAKEEVKR
jgi:hypothetical protein